MTADAVTITHNHTDHNNSTGVGGKFTLVDGRPVTARQEMTAAGLNFILIPEHGADGAAFVALVSSALLAVVSMIQGHSVVGATDPLGTFAGPLVAGAAMVRAQV